MLTFNNDPAIKQALIKRMDNHIALDELVQGATGQNGKGCTVWCALNNGDLKEGYSHSAFESTLHLPEWLAHLQDTIFEGLNVDDAKWFSAQWVKVIPVGKDITRVKWRFCAFIMKENIERVLLLDITDDLKKQVVDAISSVLSLHTTAADTGIWDESAAWSARSAARSAWSARSARSAAWSAAESAESARSAAWSAESAAESARSAAESARSAAESAAESAAWSAAESAWSAAESAWSARSAARSAESARSARSAESAYKRYADELLRLLSNE